MQDPNEDTEWNDILRAKGILPPKPPAEDDESEPEVCVLRVQRASERGLVCWFPGCLGCL